MEGYRHENTDKYCAIIFKNNKTNKLSIWYNIHDEIFIRQYWNDNEKDYTLLEVRPIKNLTALHFFEYYNKIPKCMRLEEQRIKVFDFYKYVLGADLSDAWRGKEYDV